MEFELRCELHGHQEDVRQLLVLEEDGALVTASRDKTAKLWLPEAAASTPPPPDARGFVDAATFAGHTDYVVALARVPQSLLPQGLIPAVGARGCLVTGSRDATLRLWRADDGAPLGNGAGGGQDDGDKSAAALRLVGHSYQVTGCGALPNGDVVSCALDKTARVWRLPQGKSCSTLEGHEGPVLCLAVAPSGLGILTGGGDGTARLWAWSPTATRGTCRAVFTGHTDTVRGLCVVPSGEGEGAANGGSGSSSQLLRFATASHDCTLRVWTHDLSTSPSGTAVVQASPANSAELRGHTAIIYSVACSGDGRLLASGAEDNTVRLWAVPGLPGGGAGSNGSSSANECLQVIAHPGCVWHVAFDPRPASSGGGDLFTACSDAVARAFSRDATRHAPEADREALSAAVAAFGKQAEAQAAKAEEAGGGGAGAADAPVPGLPPGVKVHDATVLTAPGRKDGEVAVVRESDGAVNAYSWDAGAGTWEKVGEVVAAPAGGGGGGAGAGAGGGGGNTIAGGGRKWHGGREWDFVFDVDAGDGGAMRRLACDRGENPYIVADRFLAQEDLPSSADFKEQIVRFIEQNTAGAMGGAPQDLPITGGGADPFTGGGGGGGECSGLPRPAYVPPPRPTDITGGFVDPFTGGAAGGGGGAAAAAAPPALPWRTFLLFNDALAAHKVGAKVRELSAALEGGEHALTEAEMGAPLEGLLRRAAAAAGGGAATAASHPLPADQATVLAKMLRWPPDSVFPVLDLARCLALERAPAVPLGDVSAAAAGSGGTAGGALAAVAAASPPPAAALTTALRFASNAFFSDSARAWALGQREALLSALAEAIEGGASTTNKASRLAMATLLLNYSAAAAGAGAGGDDDERLAAGLQLSSLANELARALPADGSEDEAARRVVVAVATAVAAGGGGSDGSGAALRDAARAMDALVAAARRLATAPAAAGSGVDAAAVAAARALLLG